MSWDKEELAHSRRLWNATRPRAFASHQAINAIRARYNEPLLTAEEYEQARDAYYARYPWALPQPEEDR